MARAVPTPYDITDIPYIPWEPSGTVWLFLVAALGLFALLLFRKRTPDAQYRSVKVVDLLIKEIEGAALRSSGADAQRISHLVRRVVEYLSNVEISSLSPGELSLLADRATPAALATTLRCLAEIEDSIYAPPNSDNHIQDRAAALVNSLREYVQIVRRR